MKPSLGDSFDRLSRNWQPKKTEEAESLFSELGFTVAFWKMR